MISRSFLVRRSWFLFRMDVLEDQDVALHSGRTGRSTATKRQKPESNDRFINDQASMLENGYHQKCNFHH